MDKFLTLPGPGLKPLNRLLAIPYQGWAGLLLLAVAWPLDWLLPGARTYWCYTPLWWGLALVIDAACLYHRGTSLLSRSWQRYLALAVLSIPAWMVFEAFNEYIARNWLFLGGNLFLEPPHGLLGALALSAVMPVIFGSAEWLAGAEPIRRLHPGPRFQLNNRANSALMGFGILLLSLVLLRPHHFFVLVWLGLFLLIETINFRLGRSTLLLPASRGDWRPILCAGMGGLVAGFFSEVWNYYSFPKWFYDVPFGDFLHVFELPFLGYLAFLPVGWELYSLYHLANGLFSRTRLADFFQPDGFISSQGSK